MVPLLVRLRIRIRHLLRYPRVGFLLACEDETVP